MTGSPKVRAFVALKPPEDWINGLRDLQSELKRNIPSPALKWVRPENIHLTLRFFGSVSDSDLDQAITLLQTLGWEFPPVQLEFNGLGCFPNARIPKVFWAAVKSSDNTLFELHAAIQRLTARLGQPPEDRAFHPHLTLARMKALDRNSANLLRRTTSNFQPVFQPWSVNEFILMESQLLSSGPDYLPLKSFTFSG
jgi:2'-5' RNA ligase